MGETGTSVNGLTELMDLASERLGGQALAASDDFFAGKENLLKAERPVFIAGKFTDRGKWMDGWESRRKRTPGHDWCIVALGTPGVVRGFNIDTSHFNGNQPEACTVEAAELTAGAGKAEAMADGVKWLEILGRTALGPTREHVVAASEVASGRRVTHVRLNIFPDGGVARLRVYGDVAGDWGALARESGEIELSSARVGGLVVAANDMHFGSRHNLVMPDRAVNMGDGWETRRKRGLTWKNGRAEEHDWAVVRLGHRGSIGMVEVDTNHFKGNYPESCRVEACDLGGGDALERAEWRELLPRTPLAADTRHTFRTELVGANGAAWTHVRLSIYPDGGVSRLRIWGRPT